MAAAAKKIEKGELLSITEIGRRVKLHRKTAADRLDDLGYEPDPTSTANNKLYLFDDEMDKAIRSAKDSMSATRIRSLRADAQLKETKLAEIRRELVPMSEAIEDLQKIISWLYQEFTLRQPKRIAPKLAKAKNVTAVRLILKADTDRVMKGLRENFETLVNG